MKTSAVLASLLFGSIAVAAPVDRRALVTTTEVVTETLVIYTTIYDDEPAAATTSEGLFYEQPQPTSVAAYPTSDAAPAYTPPAQVEPSSAYTPPAQAPAPTPTPPKEEPKPSEPAYTPPAPAASSAAPAPPAPVTPEPKPPVTNNNQATTGQTYSGVDITVYDGRGDYGMCGNKIYDTDMVVALSAGLMGPSTYDVMTGAATNPWCGQKIQIEYKGNKIEATIQDKCPGCLHPNDIDLTPAAWKALTGTDEKTRFQASWSKIA